MDSVPRDIGDQRKSFAEISSWADKVDKQQQGEERGHAAGSTAMGGTARELRKDSADSVPQGKASGAGGSLALPFTKLPAWKRECLIVFFKMAWSKLQGYF